MLHIDLIVKNQLFKIEIINDIRSNFSLIIIYILIQFKVFIYIYKLHWHSEYINLYWSIDHHMALQLTTVLLG